MRSTRIWGTTLVAVAALIVGVVTAPSAWAAPTVVLDSLSIPAAAPGEAVTATAQVRATGGSVAVQAITVAVRSGGAAFDFPGATAATITGGGFRFTSGARSFPAGTYEAFVAVQVGGRWTNLTPTRTFTVAASSIVLDSLTIPAATAGQQVGAIAQVRATGGSVAVQAITVAVRSGGAAFDFPGATAATITGGGFRFTSGARSFPAGTYEAFVAVQVGGRWTNLTPTRTFTVSPDNPVTFFQDFTGPAGAGPNQGLASPVWSTDPCWANREPCTGTLAQYRDSNARLDGAGSLVLTADRSPDAGAMCGAVRCQYSSSRITMLDWNDEGRARWSQMGGHFEARIRMPAGTGLWPAFWTIGDQRTNTWPRSGEIDIVEVLGDRPRVAHQHAHGSAGGNHVDVGGGHEYVLPSGDSTGWHTYAVDWDPGADGHLIWSVDGVVVHTITAAAAGAAWQSFRGPHALILDLGVGGTWPGPPSASTAFPARMAVDWIRVNRDPMR